MKDKQEKQKDKNCVSQHLKNKKKHVKVWEVISGIIAEEKLLPKYRLISFCYGLSRRLLSLTSFV